MEFRNKSKTMINDKLSVPRFSLALKSQKIPQVSDTTVLNILVFKSLSKIQNLMGQPSLQKAHDSSTTPVLLSCCV